MLQNDSIPIKEEGPLLPLASVINPLGLMTAASQLSPIDTFDHEFIQPRCSEIVQPIITAVDVPAIKVMSKTKASVTKIKKFTNTMVQIITEDNEELPVRVDPSKKNVVEKRKITNTMQLIKAISRPTVHKVRPAKGSKYKTKVVKKKSINDVPVCETDDEPLSKCSSVDVQIINEEPVEGPSINKTELGSKSCTNSLQRKEKSIVEKTKQTIRELAMEEVCKLFQTQSNYSNTRYFYKKIYPSIKHACEKYLIYGCRVCTCEFDDFELAKEHFVKEHSNSRTEEDVDNGNAEDKFVRKLYKCDQCGMTKQILHSFVSHWDSFHNGEQRTYSCDKCSFMTFDRNLFTKHAEKHIRPGSNKKKKKIECHLCHLSVVGIKAHMKRKHSNSKSAFDRIKCQECPKTFDSVRSARYHRNRVHLNVETNIICNECGKEIRRSSFRAHVRLHDQNKINFSCSICKSRLCTEVGLNRHMSKWHSSNGDDYKSNTIRPYNCVDCGHGFVRERTLLKHIRREHDPTCDGPEKKHLCEMCGKSFESKALLDRHEVVHTKEKKFVCETCQKAFTQLDSLRSHQVVHTGIKPFECGKCGNKYSQKYPLTQHIKKHHPE